MHKEEEQTMNYRLDFVEEWGINIANAIIIGTI